ncbi:signal peptidase II [Caldalkalibacillus salinus]|uniref:signal peptidase II n=1 Tax=Caldalkalibacillus salinus TaxID=2803787 RepID=UPI0019211571|nr:signal peptidase II [Caldalkalibacillus salinus]
MIYFIIAAIVLGLDLWTKHLVMKHMEIAQSIPIIEDYFYLTSHRNAGAAFGILQNQRWFFILVTIIVVIGVIYYLIRYAKEKKLFSWALALVLGGAIGNFIDRVRFGEVIDFLDVKIRLGSFYYYDYPIFNVADSALVVGVTLILLDTLRESIQEWKQKRQSSVEQD